MKPLKRARAWALLLMAGAITALPYSRKRSLAVDRLIQAAEDDKWTS